MSRIEHRTPAGLVSESNRVLVSPGTGSFVPEQAFSGLIASLNSPSSAVTALMWVRCPSTCAIWVGDHSTPSPHRDRSSKYLRSRW